MHLPRTADNHSEEGIHPPPVWGEAPSIVQQQQEQTQRQTQAQRIAPHQIQANLMLQCSTQELLQAILQEQQENPALDSADSLDEAFGCPYCPPFGLCAQCAQRREAAAPEREERLDVEASAGDDAVGGDDAVDERFLHLVERERQRADAPDAGLGLSGGGDGEFDPMLLARAPTSLADQLLTHLRATAADPVEAAIAEYLVDSLDEFGYLRLDIDEACAVLRVPCSLISEGLRRLQACDPPGIGARDLRECLLLQLCARREQGEAGEYDALAETLLRDHWEAFVQRRHGHLARAPGRHPGPPGGRRPVHPEAADAAPRRRVPRAVGPLPQHAEHGRPPRRDRPAHAGRLRRRGAGL